jgi:hypothetical protein
MNFLLGLLNNPVVTTLVVGAFATYIATPLMKFLHVQANSQLGSDWNTALQTALKFAITTVSSGKGVKPADILGNDALTNSVLAVAKDYVNDHANFLVDKLGLQDNQIAESINARLLASINDLAFTHGQIEHVAAGGSTMAPTPTVNVTLPPATGLLGAVEAAAAPALAAGEAAAEAEVGKALSGA